MLFVVVFCLLGAALAQTQPKTQAKTDTVDPSYGGVFNTDESAYIHPDDYNQPKDKQDKFDWALTKTVVKGYNNENVIISPISVKILLTLLAEAAGQSVRSQTRTELEEVLPYNKNLYDAKEYFKNVLASLNTTSNEYHVLFGTKIYLDTDVKVNQRFDSIAKFNYEADVETLDFNNGQQAAGHINDWVKKATGGKITDLVSEDAVTNSVLLLINALYFEGTWRFGFNKTIGADFNVAQGQKIKKQFMERTGNYYYFYSKHLDAKILRLPYNGRRFSMFMILPNDPANIETVIDRLDSETVKNEVWHMDDVEVHVVLPKFKFDSSINLNEVVKKLGIKEIFETTATLPLLSRGGSTEGKLKVSNIIQKSGIVVDEIGTTAWSATEIELVNKFGGDPREFVADHPFLFYIEDDTTGAKLFTGRVNNPVY